MPHPVAPLLGTRKNQRKQFLIYISNDYMLLKKSDNMKSFKKIKREWTLEIYF